MKLFIFCTMFFLPPDGDQLRDRWTFDAEKYTFDLLANKSTILVRNTTDKVAVYRLIVDSRTCIITVIGKK